MENSYEIRNKWLNFLYGFFTVQCFLLPLSFLGNIGTLISYKSYYGSLYGVNGLFYFLLLLGIIRIVIKILTVTNKYTTKGYGLFIASLGLDDIIAIINGFSQSFGIGVASLVLAAIVFFPNYFYVRKRKVLFDDSMEKVVCKCGICNKERPASGKCPNCGGHKKIYSIVYGDKDEVVSSIVSMSVSEENISKNNTTESNDNGSNITFTSQFDTIETQVPKSQPAILYCRKCGERIPVNSIFCNKCGIKIITEEDDNGGGSDSSINKSCPIHINSLFDLNESFANQYVQVVGFYSSLSENTDSLKCQLEEYIRPACATIDVELRKPLPNYIVNERFDRRYGNFQPVILRGILYKTDIAALSKNEILSRASNGIVTEYILKDAEFYEYWRDSNGGVRCPGKNCMQKCDDDCPIYLNKLSQESFKQYENEQGIEYLEKALKLAPYYKDAWKNLGYYYLSQQEYVSAYDTFSEAYKYCSADDSKSIYGLIISMAKIGCLHDADEMLKRYSGIFSEDETKYLKTIISNNRLKAGTKESMTVLSDEEYGALYDENFEKFWATVIAEKVRSINEKSASIRYDYNNERADWLKDTARNMGNGEIISHLRQYVMSDKIDNAENICLYDIIDEYERQIKY